MEEVLREENPNGSQPLWKPFMKQMTLVGLASQFCTELGTAQPQLVFNVCQILFQGNYFNFKIRFDKYTLLPSWKVNISIN